MFPEFHVGLPRPSLDEQLKTQASPDAMRKAIEHGRRDSALIQSCLISAKYAGLSGEDTYVTLAYHALLALEDAHQQLQKTLSLMPPAVLLKDAPANTTG